MTTSDEPTKPEDEGSSAAETVDSKETSESSPDSGAKPKPKSEAADALPESLDRTAEYVEEEAQRGDFVLRWGLVLLAMLFGFTQTNNTEALVHAKAGRYMQANGFLPPGTDVLSASAEGSKWVQLSWLFDHVSGGLNAALGNYSFTIISALFAAVAFGFAVHTAIPRVSTWWTVICIGLALLAAYPRFTPTPEVVTLAFLAMTLAWFYRWQTTASAGFPWKLPVLFVVWANFDPHVWMGLLLIGLYMLGHLLDLLIGRKGWMVPGRTSQLGMLLVCCVLGTMVNPFIYESLMEPIRLYGTEYPAMRIYTNLRETKAAMAVESDLQWYGLINPLVWMARDITTIAGTAAILLSIAMTIINMRKLDLGYLLVLLGFTTLAVAATHELAAAALVAGVLAGLNGQDWFRSNFKTEYTADGKSFAFSQAGRAITVISLAVIGLLVVVGRLTGPEGVRVGVGLDPNIETIVAGMEEATADLEEPARIFNFTPQQGDLLIWAGQKPFVDSRVALFGSGEPDDIVDIHTRSRAAFRRKRPGKIGSNDPSLWTKTLRDYKVDFIAPRMYGGRADYETYEDLSASARLSLAKFTSSIALFRLLGSGETVPERLRFRELGMKAEVEDPPVRLGLAQAPSIYDKNLFARKNLRRADSLLVKHHQRHADILYTRLNSVLEAQLRNRQRVNPAVLDALARELMGACYLTIRTANRSLSIDENDVAAYLALATSYEHLMFVDQIVAGQYLVPRELRFRMMVAAYRQAIVANPDQPGVIQFLAQTFQSERMDDEGKRIEPRIELARDLYTQYIEVVEAREDLSEQDQKELDQVYKIRNGLEEAVKKRVTQFEEYRKNEESLLPPKEKDELAHASLLVRLTEGLITAGLSVSAMNYLEEADHQDIVTRYPEVRLLYGKMLIENGDLEGAQTFFTQWALEVDKNPRIGRGLAWEFDAASVHMMLGDYKAAREIWSRHFKELRKDAGLRTQSRSGYLPLVAPMATWPESQTRALEIMMVKEPEAQALVRFYMAMSLIEEGKPTSGSKLISTLIREDPSARINVLARFSYSQISDEPIDLGDFRFGYVPLDLNAEEQPETGEKKPADVDAEEAGPDGAKKPQVK